MPGRDYVFFPKGGSDKNNLQEIINNPGRGDYTEHEIRTLQKQIKWLAEFLLKSKNEKK